MLTKKISLFRVVFTCLQSAFGKQPTPKIRPRVNFRYDSFSFHDSIEKLLARKFSSPHVSIGASFSHPLSNVDAFSFVAAG